MNPILVVDDNEQILEILTQYIKAEGWTCLPARSGEEALSLFDAAAPSLILLDIMLPGIDGLEVCRRIRSVSSVPILMITARDEDADRILGLDIGADDYIVKPFSPREVVSRIKAVLRRTSSASQETHEEQLTTLTYGALEIQPERYSVKLAGQSIACTPREVELLYLLASHPGRVFDREQILSRIWGYDFFGDTRTVDTHIKRLRQKLACEEMGKAWDIITVYGVGYKFEANI